MKLPLSYRNGLEPVFFAPSRPYAPPKQKHTRGTNIPLFGLVWIGSWLFTVGYLHLTFWKGVLAIVIWPYYIGVHFTVVH